MSEHDTHDQAVADALGIQIAELYADLFKAVGYLNGVDVAHYDPADHPVTDAIDAIHASRRDPLRFIQPIS